MNKTNFYQGNMSIQFFEFPVSALVRVQGEDALPYLQSQLTIDFHKLPVGGSRLALRLNLKGKVLFGAQIIRSAEEEFLLVGRNICSEKVIELLEQNVVADEVEFTLFPEKWNELVFYHPSSIDQFRGITGIECDNSENGHAFKDGWVYVDKLMPPHCTTLLVPESSTTPWTANISSGNPSEIELLRLQANLFRPGLEIGDEEFPQEGGLERTAVDFDKGCYLGQEVMARIHSMGKVKRRAVAVQGSGPFQETMPSNLMLEGKQVGMLKSQFSMPDTDIWFGTAILHENALPSLDKDTIVFETNEQSIKPLQR